MALQPDPTSLTSPNPENKLFVGGAPPGTDENTLQAIFSEHGEVEEVFIMRGGSRSGQACAFVRFTTAEGAVAAIQAIHGKYIMPGCTDPLVVRYADAPGSRAKKGGGGGGGGGRSFNGYGGGPPGYPTNNYGGGMGGGWGGPYGAGNAGWGGAPFPGFMPYGAMGSAAAAMGVGGAMGGLGGMGGMGNMGNMNGMGGMGLDASGTMGTGMGTMGGAIGGGLGLGGGMPLAGCGGMPGCGPMGTMGGAMGGMNGGAMGALGGMAQGGLGAAGVPLMPGGDGAFGNQNGSQELPGGIGSQQAVPHSFSSGEFVSNGGASPGGNRPKTQAVVSGKPVEGNTDWAGYTAPDGRTYYYNGKTGVSTWEKPQPAPTGGS